MASLRDKLRAVSASGRDRPAQPAPRAEDCFVREETYPLSLFGLPGVLPGETLSLMTGQALPDCGREDLCFLDTETTGLSHGAGTVAFLTGIGYFTGDAFVVRQYLMRDYDEEAFLLDRVAGHLERSRLLCTFNGASFDLPLLEARYTLQRMRGQYRERPHIDLLPVSRRVWKLRLKKCNLTNLEEQVLGMERQDDLPGALVPERYFSFLRSRDFSLLEDVLRHNARDIVSLPRILERLMTLHDAPLTASAGEDVFSLGKIYEKRGRPERARMCYRAADQGSLSLLARSRLADSYRKEGNWQAAGEVYRKMAAQRQGGAAPLIALAKIAEHREKDISSALEYTRRAIALAADRPGSDMQALQKRYQRLMMKARKG